MTTLTTPYSPSYTTYSTADDDTVRLPLPTHPTADSRPVDHRSRTAARSSTPPGCGPAGSPPPPSRRSSAWSAPS